MNLYFLYQLNYKKIIPIILFLALCIGLGFGIYYLFFKPVEPGPGEPGYVLPGGGLPEAGQGFEAEVIGPAGGLPEIGEVADEGAAKPDAIAQGGSTAVLPLNQDKITGPTLSADGQGISFYNQANNKFYTISEDGQEMLALTDEKFFQVESVDWSTDKSKAIISYPDGSNILYDFARREQISLSSGISQPVFSNQNKVAYKYVSEDGENNWLAVAEMDGSQVNLIEPLGEKADFVQVAWSPTNQVVAFYSQPIGLNKSEIFFIGLHQENFKSLIVEGDNFKGLWSPSGVKLLYHVVNSQNNYNPNLWLVDAQADNIGQHKFNLGLSTWVDKCVFSQETIVYCAVPRELQEGAGLYPELIGATQDLIYKIDLTTGLKELVANPVFDGQNNFSISAIYLSQDKKFLFFWDSVTEKIYRIQLQ